MQAAGQSGQSAAPEETSLYEGSEPVWGMAKTTTAVGQLGKVPEKS